MGKFPDFAALRRLSHTVRGQSSRQRHWPAREWTSQGRIGHDPGGIARARNPASRHAGRIRIFTEHVPKPGREFRSLSMSRRAPLPRPPHCAWISRAMRRCGSMIERWPQRVHQYQPDLTASTKRSLAVIARTSGCPGLDMSRMRVKPRTPNGFARQEPCRPRAGNPRRRPLCMPFETVSRASPATGTEHEFAVRAVSGDEVIRSCRRRVSNSRCEEKKQSRRTGPIDSGSQSLARASPALGPRGSFRAVMT